MLPTHAPAHGRRKAGFTLVEILVVIALIILLAALLFPVFSKAREVARRNTCLANLHQIGYAFTMYAADWDGYYPNTGDPYLWMGRRWRWPLAPYLGYGAGRDPSDPGDPLRSVNGGANILICPSDDTAPQLWDTTSYAYCASFYHTPAQINAMTLNDLWEYDNFPCISQAEGAVKYPDRKILAGEWLTNHEDVQVGWWSWDGARNYLFADGHAKYLPASRILTAGDGYPDPNLTVDGILGKDIN